LLRFLAALPTTKAEREKNLQFAFEVAPQGENGSERQAYRECLAFAASFTLGDLPKDRPEFDKQKNQVIERIRNAGTIKVGTPPPAFLTGLSEERRDIAAETIVSFWHQMQGGVSSFDGTMVVDWLREMAPRERRRFRDRFLADFPANPDERLQLLGYMADWNVDPSTAYAKGTSTFSVWLHFSDPTAMALFHALVMLTIVMFTVGLYTRTTATLVWVFNVMYIHRINQVLFGMDTMMNILLIYLMIGPSGAALSIDRLRARYRASKALLAANGTRVPWAERTLAGPIASTGANFAVRLWQVHFCVIYMSAALSKLKGHMWWELNAPWYTIANPEFSPIWMSFYETGLRALVENRIIMALFLGVSVLFTMIVELGFPFLIWTRLRPYMIAMSATFHASIGVFMGLTCFSLLMMCLGLAYMPALVIRRMVGIAPGTGTKFKLEYDPASKRQTTQVSLLRAADIGRQLELVPGPSSTLRFTGPDGSASGDAAVSKGLANLSLTSGLMAKAMLLPVLPVWKAMLPAESKGLAEPKSRSVA